MSWLDKELDAACVKQMFLPKDRYFTFLQLNLRKTHY